MWEAELVNENGTATNRETGMVGDDSITIKRKGQYIFLVSGDVKHEEGTTPEWTPVRRHGGPAGRKRSQKMSSCNGFEGYPGARAHSDVLASVSARGAMKIETWRA
jgi:hypothetical protein